MGRDKTMVKKLILSTFLITVAGQAALAQDRNGPTLIVTNEPLSNVVSQESVAATSPVSPVVEASMPQVNDNLYSKPLRLQDISANQVLNPTYFDPINTLTADKIRGIQTQMYDLQGEIADAAIQLQTLETVGQDLAANYYAAVATINTQLQSGTTPGNPRLKARLSVAEDALDILSSNVTDFNTMAVQIADLASVVNFLQTEARAAYGLSGSVEEDHVQLAQLEDALANTAVAIQRLLNNVNDNITRAAAYMASEQANLRTLALAITNGDLYGKSLSNRPFSMIGTSNTLNTGLSPVTPQQASSAEMAPAQLRPLMKIRFDRPDVDYTQALYMSMNEALQKYPDTQFELVAVSPGMGNPAKLAIESTRARRNAEKVLRNMVQMGIDTNRVNLANLTEDEIQFNEVHLYIR